MRRLRLREGGSGKGRVAGREMAGWENVARYDGVPIAIAGIVVVFTVLLFISCFIAMLPRVLKLIPFADSDRDPGQSASSPRSQSGDAAIAAAIGFALHLEANGAGETKD